MTTIRIREKTHGAEIKLTGHADFNPGNDIVCAAVSTITYSLINYLDSISSMGKITGLYVKDDPGDMLIEFDFEDFAEWEEIKRFVTSAYEMVSEHYPNNVFVRWDASDK